MDKPTVEKTPQFSSYIGHENDQEEGSCDPTPFDKGYYMAWWVDEKDPWAYFENKYGRKATEIGIGKKVQIDVPDGVKILEMIVPEGQVWIR